jgi:hypothetical protein
MASVSAFISKRLRLEVNAKKSAVARPETRHFLGFRLVPREGKELEVLLSERSEKRLWSRVKELIPRNSGCRLEETIERVNAYLGGWLGHFRICTRGVTRSLQGVDAHIRRRMRSIQLKHWKRRRTIVERLILLGVNPRTAWHRVYEGRRSLWALSHIPAVERALSNAYFAKLGLIPLWERFRDTWASMDAPAQLALPLGTKRL